MLIFEKLLELTFVEQKVSKTGNVYVIVRFMSENGSTMDCVYKGNTPIHMFALRTMYQFTFYYETRGKYTTLSCTDLKEAVVE